MIGRIIDAVAEVLEAQIPESLPWWRRHKGGVWELWHQYGAGSSPQWFHLQEPSADTGTRFGAGTPVVEDYRRRSLDVPCIEAHNENDS